FLPDAAGLGTTLLAVAPGRALDPSFGPDSRRGHRASDAVELRLDAVHSVRQDVDTGEDLRAALALGVGPRTAAAVARLLIAEQ
ncbi:2-phospho-L-lactate guanylyltransferase, partial [Streptomyces sp. TRM76130]|nr:2-phospho-L-lactate guanylyltransferase [Streptomyces sp. TRM76130]